MYTPLGYRSTAGSRIHSDGLCPISSAYYMYICGTLPTCKTFCMLVYYAGATSPQGQTCSTADSRSPHHVVVFQLDTHVLHPALRCH